MARAKQDWKEVLKQKKRELVREGTSADRGTRSVSVTYGRSAGRSARPKRGGSHTPRPSATPVPKYVLKYLAEHGIPLELAARENGNWVIRRNLPAKVDGADNAHGSTRKSALPAAAQTLPEPPWARAARTGIRFVGHCSAASSADEWLAAGIAQQVKPREGAKPRPIRVILGLDFGTAYTKVIANVANDRYAITFDKVVDGDNPFLLPAVLSVGADGVAHLGRHAGAATTIEDLKLHLIEQRDTHDQDAAFVAYMALVIRASRAWLFEHQRTLLGARRIDWGYNLGVPTLPWENEGFRQRYLRLLEAACLVSEFERPVSLRECRTALSTVQRRPTPLAERIQVFAEFAAQITGYVKSPRLREGPHLLVDIGAGTLDVTMFSVLRPEDVATLRDDGATEMVADSRFPIWDARVKPLGSYYLAAARSLVPFGHRTTDQQISGAADGIESIPAYCHRTGAPQADVEKMEETFAKYVAGGIAGVIRETKTHRYPRFPWSSAEVPTFICGGGSRYALYARSVRQAARSFPIHLEPISLPVPDSLQRQGVSEQFFDRLSVAFGLSFEGPEIGEIVPSWIIPDQEGPAAGRRGPPDHDPTDKAQAQ